MNGCLLAPMDILTEMFLPWRGADDYPIVHNHFGSDAITQYIPYRWFAHQSLRSDGFVGWNPLNYCGTPQFANTMSTSFDWTIQLHRWLPFWDAWHLGLFLQFWIAGAGMLVFLRSEKLRPGPALLGAVCYAANFQFIAWIYHRWALGSFCWMPLVLWSIVPLTRIGWHDSTWWRQLPRRVIAAPPLILMAFLGGTLQHSVFVMVTVACIGIAAAWTARNSPVGAARCLLVFGGIGVLAIGLAWVMFEPTIAAFRVNQAATGRAQAFAYPGGILQPLFNVVVYPFFAFPWPLGSPRTLDLWKFFRTDLFNLPYVGFLPAMMAVAGLFIRRVPLAPKILMAAGFLIPLTPLVAPLYHRIFLVGILGAVWAACCVLDGITPEETRRWNKPLAAMFCLATIAWLATSVALLMLRSHASAHLSAMIRKSATLENFSAFPRWFLDRGERLLDASPIWSSSSIGPWLLAGAAVTVLFLYGLGRIRHGVLTACVLALTASELTLLASQWVTFSPGSSSPVHRTPDASLYPATGGISALKALGPEALLYTDPSQPFTIPYPPNILSTFGIRTVRGYDSIVKYIMDGGGAPTESSPRLRDIGVTHALTGKAMDSKIWQAAGHADGLTIYEQRSNTPHYADTNGLALPTLASTFNKRTIAMDGHAGNIRVAENWNEHWLARIDGGPWIPVRKNPDTSIAVPCDVPGKVLELKFEPSSLTTSLVSITAAVVYLAAGAFLVASRSHPHAQMMPRASSP
jgi:hypothetical protein